MLHILNDMLFFCLYAKRTASLRSLFCRKILLLQILNERIQKSFTDMSFGQPKNFGTSQGFIFVQQAILVGSNQDANRACNTQFHRRSNAPCTNFIHNQKIALVFVRINNSFAFAKVQARYAHQHANGIVIADGNSFEKFTGLHLFSFFQKNWFKVNSS